MKWNPESSNTFLEKSKVRKTLVQQFEELYALVPDIKTTKSGGKFTKYSVHYDLVSRVKDKDQTSKTDLVNIRNAKELFEAFTPEDQQEYINYLLSRLQFAKNPFV